MAGLGHLLEQINSDKLKDRSDGFTELREFLHTSSQALNSKECHELLEALFISISRDRDTFMSKPSKAVEQRLDSAAELIEKLCGKWQHVFKAKTFKMIVNAIKKYIAINATDTLCEPLVVPLSKVCLVCCGNKSHVEHLPVTEWEMLVRFCCKVVHSAIATARSKGQRIPPVSMILLHCVYLLTRCKSVANVECHDSVIPEVCYFLANYPSPTTGHFHAFATLNTVVPSLKTRNLRQVLDSTYEVLQFIPGLLESRDQVLRREVLIFLLHVYPVLDYQNKETHLVQKVSDVLLPTAANLDVVFGPCESDGWYRFPLFRKLPDQKTNDWFVMVANYRLLLLCSKTGSRAKRQKTTMGSVQQPDTFTDFVLSKMSDDTMLGCLQTLALYCQEHSVTGNTKQRLVNRLLDLANSEFCGWSVICLGTLLHGGESMVDRVWQLCAQKIHDSRVSSAMSFCLAILLEKNVSDIEGLVTSFDSRSPTLSTGSIMLANALVYSKISASSSKLLLSKLVSLVTASWMDDSRTQIFTVTDSCVDLASCLLVLCGAEPIPKVDSGYIDAGAIALYSNKQAEPGWKYLRMIEDSKSEGVKRTSYIVSNRQFVVQNLCGVLDSLLGQVSRGNVNAAMFHALVTLLLVSASLAKQPESTQAPIVEKLDLLCSQLEIHFSKRLADEKRSLAKATVKLLASVPVMNELPQIYRRYLGTLCLAFENNSKDDLFGEEEPQAELPHELDEYYCSWHPARLKASVDLAVSQPLDLAAVLKERGQWQLVSAVLQMDVSFSVGDLGILIRVIGEKLLPSYEYRRSEVCLLATIKVLRLGCNKWASQDPDHQLRRDANDILNWLKKMVIEGRCQSDSVNYAMADLLANTVTHLAPADDLNQDFYEGFKTILGYSSGTLFYHLAELYEPLFEATPVMDHAQLYEMLKPSLQPNQDDLELFALSTKHYTAIGKCGWYVSVPVYSLLELAKQPFLVQYVKWSLELLATYFGYKKCELFENVADSVLYAWCYQGMWVEAIPFKAIGYSSLRQFYIANLEVVVANVVAFAYDGYNQQLDRISKECQISVDQLLERGFYKAMAFSKVNEDLPNQISNPEEILKEQLGARFDSLLYAQMVEIVGELMRMADTRCVDPTGFAKSVYKEPPQELPAPSNRVIALGDLTEAIKGFNWQYASFVYVSRVVLSRGAHTSSVELCLAIRRIVLLIELSGPYHTSAYACELLLRGLTPLMRFELTHDEAGSLIKVIFEQSEDTLKARFQEQKLMDLGFDVAATTRDVGVLSWLSGYLTAANKLEVLYKTVQKLLGNEVEYSVGEVEAVLGMKPKVQDLCLGLMRSYPSPKDLGNESIDKLLRSRFYNESHVKWLVKLGAEMFDRGESVENTIESGILDEELLQESTKHRAFTGILKIICDLVKEGDFDKLGHVEDCVRRFDTEYPDYVPKEVVSLCQTSGLPPIHVEESLEKCKYEFDLVKVNLALLCRSVLPQSISILITKVPEFNKLAFKFLVMQLIFQNKKFAMILSQLFDAWINSKDRLFEEKRLLLQTFFHMRFHAMTRDITTSSRVLNINLLQAASNANGIGMHKHALLLLEMDWGSGINKDTSPLTKDQQDVLVRICEKVPDPDLYYGVRLHPSFQTAMGVMKREGRHLSVLSYESACYDAGMCDTGMLASSMLKVGMTGLSKTIEPSSEWAWKLGQWDLPEPEGTTKHEMLFKMFKRGVRHELYKEVLSARDKDMMEILAVMNDTAEMSERFVVHRRVTEDRLTARRINWSRHEALAAEAKTVVQLCDLARKNGDTQKVMNWIVYLDKLTKTCGGMLRVESDIQSGRLLWELNEQTTSIGIYKNLVAQNAAGLTLDKAGILATLADWSSKARHQDQQYILENYLEPAAAIEKSANRGLVYHTFARFCDDNYGSEMLDNIDRLRASKKREVEELQEVLTGKGLAKEDHNEVRNQLAKAEKALKRDEAEYDSLKQVRDQLLQNCVKYYMKSIIESAGAEDSSRFCAIWLANPGTSDVMEDLIGQLPTSNMVPWVNQLSSRLAQTDNAFQRALFELLTRMCQDHPYHCLYQIMALRKTSTDDRVELDNQSRRARRRSTATTLDDTRAQAANSLWQSIRVDSAVLAGIEAFCREARILANGVFEKNKAVTFSEIKKSKSGKPSLSRENIDVVFWEKVGQLRIPAPTLNIIPRPSCDYSDLPKMTGVVKKIGVAGGLSAPKIVTVNCENGVDCKMLFKGGDDLRQDAIMEQVFSQANDFFKHDKESRKRLKIRTYKVIPMDSKTGIIEFVANTTAFIDVITPLRAKYRPKDITAREARDEMVRVAGQSDSSRIDMFQSIEQRLKPVLRHFFFETFLNPDDWFQARINYSRSTAAISILGWVLGVGDRHCSNIMLDSQTGETVHIDLGIAFDQGKLLPKPETVPFRLSRDVVDGMGVTGVEGVFKRCCEFTLSVLRKNHTNISTILNVLRYDPLHNWTLSPLKRRKVQGDSGVADTKHNENEEADRALSTVQNKLSEHLSVEATVRGLIQEASSEKNLALLFHGWQPYL